jgi:hypothetical protein
MLRKSFSRAPNRTLFAHPISALIQTLATAGLWPTGVLIWRLWLYASHQRFRAGELLWWLSGGDAPPAVPAAVGRIRPTGLLVAALVAWLLALIAWVGVIGRAMLAWMEWTTPLPTDPRQSYPALTAAVLLIVATMLQIVAVLTLRLRVEQALQRLNRAVPRLRLTMPDPTLPAWTIWPMLLAAPWVILWLSGHRWLGWWTIGVLVAMLAGEAQRGYISVTDRRLRYAIARRIGFLLNRRRPDR